MFLIGGVFVFFSGLIYFLFMAAWLNVFLVVGQIAAITITGGIVALLIGGINVKDFFLFKQGVSLVIPESAKPKLFERMRGLLKAPTLPAMIAGTVVLALSANAYELLCTAGFPMVYTRVLTLHRLTTFQYYQYLVLYNIVYVVPLADHRIGHHHHARHPQADRVAGAAAEARLGSHDAVAGRGPDRGSRRPEQCAGLDRSSGGGDRGIVDHDRDHEENKTGGIATDLKCTTLLLPLTK